MQNEMSEKRSVADLALDLAAFLGVAGAVIMSYYCYGALPETIATHFNFQGKPDGYGDKSMFLMLPVLLVVLYGVMTLVLRMPDRFNYLVKITEENAQRQYQNALTMIRVVRLEIVALLTYLTFAVSQSAKGQLVGIPMWFVPVMVVVLLLTIAYFIRRSFQFR